MGVIKRGSLSNTPRIYYKAFHAGQITECWGRANEGTCNRDTCSIAGQPMAGWKGEGVVTEDHGNTVEILKDGFAEDDRDGRALLMRSQVRVISFTVQTGEGKI